MQTNNSTVFSHSPLPNKKIKSPPVDPDSLFSNETSNWNKLITSDYSRKFSSSLSKVIGLD